MLKRIQKSMQEKDEGFTLIELLVVMIIIGILAAIAIPVFLSQKKKAYETSLKSDLHQIATNIETALVDSPAVVSVAANGNTVEIKAYKEAAKTTQIGDTLTVGLSNGNALVAAPASTADVDPSTGKYQIELVHGSDPTKDPVYCLKADGVTQTLSSGAC